MADPVDVGADELGEEVAKDIAIEEQQQQVAADETLKQVLQNTDGDPCNSHEWSIVFLLVFCMAFVAMALHLWHLFKRRAELGCFDVLTVALFVSTVIQFGPMMSQVLHSGHGLSNFTQSGCKMLFYTDYGMRHVVTFIVCSFFAYTYLILFHRFEPDNLDGKMRGNVAWLILLLLGIEAVFGMPAAVYVDVGPRQLNSCIWTPTMQLTVNQIVALEMIVRPITPYILPFLLLLYPLFVSTRAVRAMEESKLKSTMLCSLLITWAYFAMNMFYAILLVYESASLLNGDRQTDSPNWPVVCNLKWAFFLLHQTWFLLAPIALLVLENEKGNPPAGHKIAISAYNSVRRQMRTRI